MQPARLNNRTCALCGKELDKSEESVDHVIARNFVPKGYLENEWNLQVKVCRRCNGGKSDLEDELSAITLQPNVAGQFPDETAEQVVLDSGRKGKRSSCRATRLPVADSSTGLSLSSDFGDVRFTFKLEGPPQPDAGRAFQLAYMQVTEFMYFLTYDEDEQCGFFHPGAFCPLPFAMRSDWGNETHRTFLNHVAEWETRLVGTTARGYFRVALRYLEETDLWSWALEWNRNLRLCGFFGEEAVVRTVVDGFPKPTAAGFQQVGSDLVRVRIEEAIPDEQDQMFALPLGSN